MTKFAFLFFSLLLGLSTLYGQNNQSHDTKNCLEMALKQKGKKALQPLQDCLATTMNEKGEQDSLTSLILHKIGVVYFSRFKEQGLISRQQAVTYWERALAIRQQIFPANHLDIGHSYFNLSSGYYEMEDFDKALDYAQKCEQLRGENSSNNLNYIKVLELLGKIHKELGDYTKAIQFYNISLEKIDKIEVSPHRKTEILNNRGNVYNRQKKFDKAAQDFQKAIQLLSFKPKKYAKYLASYYASLARTYEETENFQNAEIYFQKAADYYEQNNKFSSLSIILSNWAVLDMKQNKLELAEQKLKKALSLSRQLKNFPSAAGRCENIGEVFFKKMSYDSSLYYHQMAINYALGDTEKTNIVKKHYIKDNRTIISSKLELLIYLESKARTLRARNKQGDLELALNVYKTIDEVLDLLKKDIKTEDSRLFWRNNSFAIYDKAIETAYELYQINPQDSYLQDILTFSQKSKAAVLFAAVNDANARQSFLPPHLFNKEKLLNLQLNYYQQRYIEQNNNNESSNAALDSVLYYQQKYDYLIQQLEKDFPAYYQWKYSTEMTDISIIKKQLLQKDKALLDFFVGNKNIYTICLSQDNFVVIKSPKTADFDKNMSLLRWAMTGNTGTSLLTHKNKESHSSYLEESWKLYHSLVVPAISHLNTNIKQLLIIPHDKLNYIPFEGLITQSIEYQSPNYGAVPFLIYDYQITYAYSITLLLQEQQFNHQVNIPFLGYAPSFENFEGEEQNLEELFYNQQSIAIIQDILGGLIFTKQQATKYKLLSIKDDVLILHLSTHAQMNDSEPLQNKIFMADEAVTTAEIYNLPIHTKLAVLSACETGTGQLQKGEGMMSLARAFMYSGCPSVVASLWKADDQMTAELMRYFYENLKKGQAKDKALHHAKLTFLESQNQDALLRPFYWAAFVHVGNTDPVFIDFSWWQWFMPLSIGFGLGIFFFITYRRKKV